MSTLVSVDLDDLACYHAIHGLAEPPAVARSLPLRRWLPRFLELFDALEVRATFFVIGRVLERDLEDGGEGAELLRQAQRAGHELANHSHQHDYRMVDWNGAAIAEDVARCDRLLRGLGADPVGFRAPGYTHDFAMLNQVAALGYRYDSSALPSLPYYLAKRSVMAWMRVRGQGSAAHPGGARSFVGSTRPRYLPTVGLWEVPMSVSPWLRLPLIGTTLFAGPRLLAARLRREAERTRHLHLELHGMDLADPDDPGIVDALRHRQPELGEALEDRTRGLRELLSARGGGQTIRAALERRRPAGREWAE